MEVLNEKFAKSDLYQRNGNCACLCQHVACFCVIDHGLDIRLTGLEE